MTPPSRLAIFAITAPGLEMLAADELRAIGVASPVVEPGGVSFAGTLADLQRANLHLRTASRIVVRIAEFHAEAFYELEKRAKRTPWGDFLGAGADVRLRVTCRKSRLYHSDAVAERVAAAIAAVRPEAAAVANADADDTEEDAESPAQLFIVRLLNDRCTISADASGALLHLRGYRQAVAKAPLRETLAAAMLLGSGWRAQAPLVDPLCGAGTIAIEGAMMARRIPPGIGRRFAFMDWPGFDEGAWRGIIDEASAATLPASPVRIQASDRDDGAVEAAASNAARAGVSSDIELSVRPLSAIEPPDEPGWIVSNPPYGHRVGDADRLRNLYAQLGNVARAKCPGWTVALLTSDRQLERQLQLPLDEALRTSNGGIPVRLVVGQVQAAADVPA
jgi:putative N6-adenine-specific DNA methylase